VVSARALVAFAFALLAAAACTAPRLVEDSPLACLNAVDDDGDGLTDCADPECVATGVCETTLETCRNGLDDNRDGKIDCDDPACAAAGLCEPFDVPCSPKPESGCPRGMACYSRPGERHGSLCARPGMRVDNEACTGNSDCRPGLACDGVCVTACLEEHDCPRESHCARAVFDAFSFGVCTHPCSPFLQDCTVGDCVAAHQFGYAFDQFEFVAFCIAKPSWSGAIKRGEVCRDPAPIQDPTRMCENGLVCVPAADGVARCRGTCVLRDDEALIVPCVSPAEKCMRPHPLDARDGNRRSTGVCVP
jgi:hypothetical protein